VHYQEKFASIGRIAGGFNKREGKESEKATLTSRLIDRPLRPLFPDGFKNEVQIIITVYSYDKENEPDMIAMVAASAALSISGIPFNGPIAGVRVGYINNEFVYNPTPSQIAESDLDLIVAGTKDGVLMVESEAKELTEAKMLEAVQGGFENFQPVIKAIAELKKKAGKEDWKVEPTSPLAKTVEKAVSKALKADVIAAFAVKDKQERTEAVANAHAKAKELYAEDAEEQKFIDNAFKTLEKEILRGDILAGKKRIDGRKTTEVRPIEAEVGVLPRCHGSALFTRGETQALVSLTLGTSTEGQLVDDLDGLRTEPFMLHYNFPPFSVGEAGRMGPPKRRELGHGKLAWRAIHPMMPSLEEFDYSKRIISEILESNGSSSMATVCGTTLALMDGGVPLKKPVAGIAMGLIKENDNFAVLTDILGDEDHLGDMDFKVAGTKDGITALQMDIKITSVTFEIMQQALAQAKDGRDHILGKMAKALKEPRKELSDFAPKIVEIMIPKDKIREIIGSGGSTIRAITEESQAKINIEDDGTVSIAGENQTIIDKAISLIKEITAEAEEGQIYDGEVVNIQSFGAFVRFFGKQDGLVHISEITGDHIEKVEEYLAVGDKVKVKYLGKDKRGKTKLSISEANFKVKKKKQ
ncbi:MAG: polyribonucleotide nucleotidyltransferase, partial [Alphaproteobacteria bacterium]|nr:polyribonucleotide nucleotidyltransferase [Alphaproteobacteria bacterium]